MQTVFLVWLPGLGGLFLGAGAGVWLAGKAYSLFTEARRIVNRDKLLLESARTLKEVCGTSNFDMLPGDLQERVAGKVYEIESSTHKQL